MFSISDFQKKYHQKIDSLDLDLLIAAAIKKPREFVLTHPEYKINNSQISNLKSQILRRIKHEPLSYILGKKEFYGLEFKVNKNVLIPRPETEQIVELASYNIKHGTWNRKNKLIVADIGTGSGNIIISLAKTLKNYNLRFKNYDFFATDISSKTLAIAKQNAKKHKLDKKIKFLQGNLLEPMMKTCYMFHAPCSMLIIANLPYLSSRIYNSAPKDVKNHEPKSALLSRNNGLYHYINLFKQIKEIKKNCSMLHVSCFMEISPEQKTPLKKAILTAFPQSQLIFLKDLAGKYRIVKFEI